MNFIPAFYFTPTVVCVDDEPLVLEALERFLSKSFKCKLFGSAHETLEFLKQYDSKLAKLSFLHEIADFEYDNSALQSAVELDIAKIIEIKDDKSRQENIAVLVSDYYMPEVNGLELCKAVDNFNFKKMLLTASSEYKVAIDALNNHVIDNFINKSDNFAEIVEHVNKLAFNYFCDLSQNLKNLLEAEGSLPFTDPTFIAYFKQLIVSHEIKEFYLIDRNGSYLLVDANGKESVLIVHTDKSMISFVNLLEDNEGLQTTLNLVRNKQKLPFFGIQKNILDIDANNLDDYLYDIHVISGTEKYYTHLLSI